MSTSPAPSDREPGIQADTVAGVPTECNESELFHVEQFDPSPDLGSLEQRPTESEIMGEIARIETIAQDLSSQVDAERNPESDAHHLSRMFAHEVNNLAVGIAGRAQRALKSGDKQHIEDALRVAAQLGTQLRSLCNELLDDHIEPNIAPLNQPQIIDIQRLASISGLEYLDIVGVAWDVEIDDYARVPMGAAPFGQVLINLYRNALMGIAKAMQNSDNSGGEQTTGTIRLRVMGIGACNRVARLGDNTCPGCRGGCDRGGVVVRVEDSGIGFRNDNQLSDGHGLGLEVCRTLCARYGGRVMTGNSEELGGGCVDIVFV